MDYYGGLPHEATLPSPDVLDPRCNVEFATGVENIRGWDGASWGNSALVLRMGEGEEGGGGFSIANGNVGFQPQEDIPLSNTYQQPVPLPGLLAPDGYASTARVFQHHGQFPLDTSGLFTEEPPTTQTLPGGLPPEEIFDHNVLTDEEYADLALLEAILDLPNYAYTYLSLPTLPFDPAGTLQSASYPPFVASQNTLFGSTPSSTAVTSYPTSAGTPDIASPSSSWASTASLPTSSTTSPTSFEISPTGSARSKAGRYKCDQLGCKSKHTWATFGDLKYVLSSTCPITSTSSVATVLHYT